MAEKRRGHVLIEAAERWVVETCSSVLKAEGFDVEVCAGPDASCPLLRGAACALADRADAILCCLPLGRPRNRSVLRRLTADRLRARVIMLAPAMGTVGHNRSLLRNMAVIPRPLRREQLLAAIAAAREPACPAPPTVDPV